MKLLEDGFWDAGCSSQGWEKVPPFPTFDQVSVASESSCVYLKSFFFCAGL